MLDQEQRQALKDLLLPKLGSNPSTWTVAPYVGNELAKSLPITNEVGSVAEWIIDRLLEQRDPKRFILTVERLDDDSAGGVGRLVELAVDLKGDPSLWRPARRAASPELPAFWNVPVRNDYFTGREGLLRRLDGLFGQNDRAAVIRTMTGLGGVGKTQVAVEFCHRHREAYPFGVFWADASSAASLTAAYASFASELGWTEEDAPVDVAAEVWLRRSSRTAGWLLVLDNADEPGDIDPFIPRTGFGHVLVTTRHQNPGWGGDPLPVDVWGPREATDFLLRRARQAASAREDGEALAEALGYLPLALEQAAAYLDQNRAVRVRDYLDGFSRRRIEFIESEKSDRPLKGEYEKTVAGTWALSFEKLTPAAREALHCLAFLDPDGVCLQFFAVESPLGDALDTLDVSDRFVLQREVVKPLTSYSLIQVVAEGEGAEQGPSIRLHRLVQEVMLHRLVEGGGFSECRERVYRALDSLFPASPDSPKSWPEGSRWVPHVLRLARLFSRHRSPKEDFELWNRAGLYGLSAGRALIARELFELLRTARRLALGDRHPATLVSMNNLAETLWKMGDFQGARDLHREVLEARRDVLGEEHPETLLSMSNLAAALWALGEAQGALELNEEALGVRRRVLGEEDPDTLVSMNNLAETLWLLGEAEEARDLHEETLLVRRRVLGDEHPATLVSMNNLAASRDALGDSQGARDLNEEVLAVRRRVLGDEHPETLVSINNLAGSLWGLGDARGARDLHEEALALLRKVHGDEHPDTLRSIINLAAARRSLGDLEGARELDEEALSIRRRMSASSLGGAGIPDRHFF